MPPARRKPRDAKDATALAKRNRWYEKHKDTIRPRENEKRARLRAANRRLHKRTKEAITRESLTIVNANAHRRPTFRFIDATGKEHIEKWETAEEIAKRLNLTPPPPPPC